MGFTTRRALGAPKQLTAYTTVGTSPVQPWLSDTNGKVTPLEGVVVQFAPSNSAGTYIEVGGPGITAGNGLVLNPGDTDIVWCACAAQVWIVPSAAGLNVRGQVR